MQCTAARLQGDSPYCDVGPNCRGCCCEAGKGSDRGYNARRETGMHDDDDPRHLRLLPRLGGGAGRRRRDRRRGAGGALHPQEARLRLPGQRDSLLPGGGGPPAGGARLVGFYDKPLLKFERLLETYLAFAPARLPLVPARRCRCGCKQKLHLPREIATRARAAATASAYVFTEHHESHAASAFFPSPFEEAAILTLDGVGEWATASFGVGRGNRIDADPRAALPALARPALLGVHLLHAASRSTRGEYKLMGLAPYGEPTYADADPARS